jgi:hypothetical protein
VEKQGHKDQLDRKDLVERLDARENVDVVEFKVNGVQLARGESLEKRDVLGLLE